MSGCREPRCLWSLSPTSQHDGPIEAAQQTIQQCDLGGRERQRAALVTLAVLKANGLTSRRDVNLHPRRLILHDNIKPITEPPTGQRNPRFIAVTPDMQMISVSPRLNYRDGIDENSEASDLAGRSQMPRVFVILWEGYTASLIKIRKSDSLGVAEIDQVDEGTLNKHRTSASRRAIRKACDVGIERLEPAGKRRVTLNALDEIRVPHSVTPAAFYGALYDHQFAECTLLSAIQVK